MTDAVLALAVESRRASQCRILLKARADGTASAYSLQELTVPPGRRVPAHVHHDEEEAWYIIEGALTFEIDGRQAQASAGAFVLVPR